jgi:hypothetical protein
MIVNVEWSITSKELTVISKLPFGGGEWLAF